MTLRALHYANMEGMTDLAKKPVERSLTLPRRSTAVSIRKSICVGLTLFLVSGTRGSVSSRMQRGATAQIEIGPNIRVSDKPVPYLEPCIAAHPRDKQILIISASRAVSEAGIVADAFLSADGGKTWTLAELPRMQQALSEGRLKFALDSCITYASDGVAYYSSLLHMDGQSDSSLPVWVYRSDDGGKRWTGPTVIASRSVDHPAIIGTGNGANKQIYIAALADGSDSLILANSRNAPGIAILRSNDSGSSFHPTAFIVHDNLGHNVANPLILADGSLLIPYVDFPADQNQALTTSRAYVVHSQDGGTTFGLPQFVAERAKPGPDDLFYLPQFAVDLSNSKYRGRIYAVWPVGNKGIISTSINHSSDNGRTWSASQTLRNEKAGSAVLAAAAVSSNGTVGVLWIQDEKDSTNPDTYRAYFSASTDGGEIFSPAHTVSDEVSVAKSKVNEATRCPT